MHRRFAPLLVGLAALIAPGRAPAASDAIDPARATTRPGDPARWHDIRLLGVDGRGWDESRTIGRPREAGGR